ncbi:MAG: dihydroorotase [Bacteroidales bacterium]|nr:dihydroorotase [Bacteroidales bacterium]
MGYIIKNATLVNEGTTTLASVVISGDKIEKILPGKDARPCVFTNYDVIDAEGLYLIPGVIDEHVHFREPGLTQKADIFTESHAAVAGGVTSFMDMPNTNPQTTTQALLQQKFDLAAQKSAANYSFYLGATNDNIDEILKTDPKKVCGIKLFMGSSTGNMLVNEDDALVRLFNESPCLIAAHCEDEQIIHENTVCAKDLASKGEVVADAGLHPFIRTTEACYKSTSKAVDMATKFGARLHVMHISTKSELTLFRNDIPLKDKKITAETCPHYLTFCDKDYDEKGFAIKCNPAIKMASDREILRKAIVDGHIDTIGTDHAPHLWQEKFTDDYFTAKSGFPSIQNSLDLMLNLYHQGVITLPQIVKLMCHNPAELYQIKQRGFIREGYYADLVLVDLNHEKVIKNDDMLYKCGWTPYDGMSVKSNVTHTFVNGNLVYHDGIVEDKVFGKPLEFER